MPYYKDIHTLFIHIPKTGGSSLEDYLRTKSTETLLSGHNNTILPTEALQRKSLQHQSYSTLYHYRQLLDIPFDSDMKVITIVRNPYNRIISDLHWYRLIDASTSKKCVYDIIQSFVEHDMFDNHNLSQHTFITDEKGELYPNITIFRTESLTKQLQEHGFLDYTGQEKENEYFHFLNEDSIRFINRVYQKDFEMFGYTML